MVILNGMMAFETAYAVLFSDFVDDEWCMMKVLLIQKCMEYFILNLKPTELHRIDYDLKTF